MRVGIYNRWLATLGGGEKHSLTIAEYLSRHHSVQVITHKPVSREEAAARLNVDLARVEFVYIPDCPAVQITPLTAEFDFFICASFLDIFPSRAPRSAMVVFFPTPLSAESSFRLRRRVGLILRRWLMVPTFEDGVLHTESLNGTQVRQTAAQVTIKLPPAPREYAVNFDLIARDPSARQAIIMLDDQIIESLDLKVDGTYAHCRMIISPSRRVTRRLTIRTDTDVSATPVKMILARFEIEHPRYRAYKILFERWLKTWGLKLHRIPPDVLSFIESLKTYDALWAISKFTQTWIKRYWDSPSQVLYPPVDVENFAPGEKQNQILSVGRFFVGSHNKKHDVLIKAFKEMVNEGLMGWKLHLVGGVGPNDDDKKYLQQLRVQAEGYPIEIHTDIPFVDLVKLYSESAIYWHACGFGEDEEREPIKFEHFGITTVEAMASGCVPVVINKGGQSEIVQHGRNGFLWNTLPE
ncbi:MAG: glycosyltransferase, partial [Anaerolineae bacterium]|nr:glycosyltransferase [Anaerolineae bacterium]